MSDGWLSFSSSVSGKIKDKAPNTALQATWPTASNFYLPIIYHFPQAKKNAARPPVSEILSDSMRIHAGAREIFILTVAVLGTNGSNKPARLQRK